MPKNRHWCLSLDGYRSSKGRSRSATAERSHDREDSTLGDQAGKQGLETCGKRGRGHNQATVEGQEGQKRQSTTNIREEEAMTFSSRL